MNLIFQHVYNVVCVINDSMESTNVLNLKTKKKIPKKQVPLV